MLIFRSSNSYEFYAGNEQIVVVNASAVCHKILDELALSCNNEQCNAGCKKKYPSQYGDTYGLCNGIELCLCTFVTDFSCP